MDTGDVTPLDVIEELVKNPDRYFETFSEDMAEKIRAELRRVIEEHNKEENGDA